MPPARSIAEERQGDHHQNRDKDHDNGYLEGDEQKAHQRDELFEQSDDDENQSNDSAESTGSFKNAATHINSTPKKLTDVQDLRSNGSGVTSRRANCVVSPVRKVAVSTGRLATTDGGGRRESKRTIRSDDFARRM